MSREQELDRMRQQAESRIKQSMIDDGIPEEFVDSIDHKSIFELMPDLMRFYRLREAGLLQKRMHTILPPLRYEMIAEWRNQ